MVAHYSLEAPFVGSPRVMSEAEDASDSEEPDDLITDDIKLSDSSRHPPPSYRRRDSLAIPNPPTKRTTLNLPATRELQLSSPTTLDTPIPLPPPKENPRKRRRSELFTTSGKENLLPPSTGSNLFSPPSRGTNEKATRGVLLESSPPRPSIFIPAGLTRLESPNKPSNIPTTANVVVQDKVLEFAAGLDEEGGGGGGRRVSRARKQVNYALPNLRDKMRRGNRPEEFGAKSSGRGRSVSMDRSVTPDTIGVCFVLDVS
jgi:hypothetical protein